MPHVPLPPLPDDPYEEPLTDCSKVSLVAKLNACDYCAPGWLQYLGKPATALWSLLDVDCPCCSGTRALIALLVAFVLGALVF